MDHATHTETPTVHHAPQGEPWRMCSLHDQPSTSTPPVTKAYVHHASPPALHSHPWCSNVHGAMNHNVNHGTSANCTTGHPHCTMQRHQPATAFHCEPRRMCTMHPGLFEGVGAHDPWFTMDWCRGTLFLSSGTCVTCSGA